MSHLLLPRMGSETICFLAGPGEIESAKFALISAMFFSAVGVVVVDVKFKSCIAPCMQTGLPDERRAILVALIPHTHNLEHIHLLEISSPINLIIT